ncbi:hypothetical protein PR048_025601, partial [Dryococelus australis]
MICTRPDISYELNIASRTLENPFESDIIRVKRIFQILACYSNADLGGDKMTGRSITGIVCLYSGGAISWFNIRQCPVSISTTEAEIIAASEGTQEIIRLKRLLQETADYKE